MKAESLCAATSTAAICCLASLSCSPTATTGGGTSFTEEDYLRVTRQFAEAISARDYDGAWKLASRHLTGKSDRAGFEKTCESFFERTASPKGVREVGVNETGDELELAIEELEMTAPPPGAKAWCVASFRADMDINMAVILVDDSGTLRVGDFWFFDD